jgi:hypothetical protein
MVSRITASASEPSFPSCPWRLLVAKWIIGHTSDGVSAPYKNIESWNSYDNSKNRVSMAKRVIQVVERLLRDKGKTLFLPRLQEEVHDEMGGNRLVDENCVAWGKRLDSVACEGLKLFVSAYHMGPSGKVYDDLAYTTMHKWVSKKESTTEA